MNIGMGYSKHLSSGDFHRYPPITTLGLSASSKSVGPYTGPLSTLCLAAGGERREAGGRRQKGLYFDVKPGPGLSYLLILTQAPKGQYVNLMAPFCYDTDTGPGRLELEG